MVSRILKNPIYYALGVYVILAISIGITLRNGLIVFLGWNIVLAAFVSFFADVYVHLNEKGYKRLSVIPLILCIIFFPNAIYVITDFIHLQVYEFFRVYSDIYSFSIADWIVFGMIVIGALLASKSGITALDRMKNAHPGWIKRYYYLCLSILFLASSVGIYIGRFLRFNSWDIFKLFTIMPQFLQNFTFFIGFVSIMWVIHVVLYVLLTKQSLKLLGGKS